MRVYPAEELSPAQIQTAPYPGFPTDLQPQFTTLSLKARDRALCGNRFTTTVSDTSGTWQDGADITVSQNRAVVNGGRPVGHMPCAET